MGTMSKKNLKARENEVSLDHSLLLKRDYFGYKTKMPYSLSYLDNLLL